MMSAAAGAAVIAACGSTQSGTLTLTVGGESDALTKTPAPTQLAIDAIDADGGVTSVATAKLPTQNIDLGDQDSSGIVSIRVNAKDDSGKILLTGMTLPIEYGALAGSSVPVFIQRNGELARMPGTFSEAREAPVPLLIIGRYILFGAGTNVTDGSSQIYDTASVSAFVTPPTLPRVPASMAALGTQILIIDANGGTWLELSDSTTASATAPSGGTFAEVAGGQTFDDGAGVSYVVGATRKTGDATPRVLRIDTDGTLTFLALTEARLGASAAWVAGRGLVVVGGSSLGAGVEVLPPGATAASSALAYPADATVGLSATGLDASHVLVAGGVDSLGNPAAVRVFDLGCSGTCAATLWTNGPAIALSPSQIFSLGFDGNAQDALLFGDDRAGASHVFRLSPTSSTEIPYKVARHGARAVRLAIPAIAVVGGANVVESFTP
ncbi:MAG: hypothetical protein ABI461_00035 [Polyangiaceae bacterium]